MNNLPTHLASNQVSSNNSTVFLPEIIANLTPCIQLKHPWLSRRQIKIWVKLDYLNHPVIQGNKLHKLKYNLQAAQQQHATAVLTFGGAYSNHIAATAVAAKQIGLPSIGVIRGQELATRKQTWSHTLQQAQQHGMQFIFVSRQEYRQKLQAPTVQRFLNAEQAAAHLANIYVIPEGGSNALAVQGFDDLAQQLTQQVPNWTHLFCPVGTGGTLAGLVANLSQLNLSPAGQNSVSRQICGIAVLKQADYLQLQIEKYIQQYLDPFRINFPIIDWRLELNGHCGGYAKAPNYLTAFQKRMENSFKIPLDSIYTAKLFYGVFQQIKHGNLPAGSEVILLHTGGLQGNPPQADVGK